MPVIREIEALYPKRMVVCSAGLTRPSMNIPTSEVAVPRNAELPRTVPLTTGRSLFAPSPLLSTPVVALKGRAEANCARVPAVMWYGRHWPR